MTGVVAKWSIRNPLESGGIMKHTSIGHRDTGKHRIMHTKNNLVDISNNIRDYPYKWKIEINAEFNGDDLYLESRVFVLFCKLSGVNECWFKTMEQLFEEANMDDYVTTHVSARVLPGIEITEKDYEWTDID